HLELTFKRLGEANLKLQPKKCSFLPKYVKFLGYQISKDGIEPDPGKLETVKEFRLPTDQSEVRGFLGLTGYYRQLIENYARIAKPLTLLTKKNPPLTANRQLILSEDAIKAFNTLKQKLMESPIVANFKSGAPLILYTDACDYAAGYVLHQIQDNKERVLVYGSHTFNETQRRYCVTDKEILAITIAVKKLRHYLAHDHFIIKTDHHSLCFLKNVKQTNGRLAKAAYELQGYDYEIQFKSGRLHANADCMSRFPVDKLKDQSNSVTVYCQSIKGTKTDCILKTNVYPYYNKLPKQSIATIKEMNLEWKADIYTESDKIDNFYIEYNEPLTEKCNVFTIEEVNLIDEQNKDNWIVNIKRLLDGPEES
ncbi:MAG: RNase H-like domain-containing protein, partial [Candidatus Dormibacteria bacterium]